MNAPAADRDAASVRELQQIEALVRQGRAAEALGHARVLFDADRTPTWRIADLCKLTAAAAQAVGDAPLAEATWRQAAEHARGPTEAADAQANLGVLLAGQKRQPEAEACWRRALELDADHVVALANLAVVLAASGRAGEAEARYRHALALDPANAVAHTNLGVLLAATQRRAEAELCHRRALALQPDSASAHTNLGLVLLDLARLDEAEPHLRRALALAPGSAEVHSNLGNLLARRGSDAEAEQCLRRALVLDPTLAAAHCNLGVLLADQRRDAPAEAHFRSAIALRPGYALARLDLSCLLLAQGRFKEGWTLHEARHDPQLPDNGIAPPNVSFPAWRGEPLAGRSLLIWAEQGLGDQIQFCRYVPRLKAQGAARITLVCQRVLASLLGTLPGIDVVLPADVVDNAFHVEAAAIAVHDTWVFPLSLPLWLGTDLSTLPAAPIPYLSADPARVGAWTRRVHDDERGRPAKMLRVGLVWRGNPMHHNDAERSLPGLSTLTPLWSVPNCRFVSLQTGRAAAEADTPPGALPLVALGAELGDFADSAAALAALDLLICVDTSIAHLAGALGLPCWVLLPRHRTDWRWLRDRDDSPWYPRGMRLFRQARRGDWAEVVERVRAALVPTAARSGSTP